MVNPLCLLLSPPSRIKAWDLLLSLTGISQGVRSGKELPSSPRCVPGGPGCLQPLVRSVDLSWVGGGSAVALQTWGLHACPCIPGDTTEKASRSWRWRGGGEQQAGGPRCPTLPHLPALSSAPCKSGYRDVCAPPCLRLCPQLSWVFLCILGAQSQTCAFLGQRKVNRQTIHW